MKKIIITIQLFIIVVLLCPKVFATSWKYEWENTVVYIPVGESIERHKYTPVAKLFRDNVYLSDANISYLREGDWLFYLADVNTSVVGEYEVWYKAFENDKYRPGTCPGYKCKIKFVVTDKIAPTVEVLNPYVKLKRNSKYDLYSNIVCHDNYNSVDELSLYSSSYVDFSQVGIYEIKIIVMDSSNNKTEVKYTLEVYEDTPPTILYKNEGSPIYIPLNGKSELSEYFEAVDVIDGDITKKIKFSEIDTAKLGDFYCTASVENSAGLESTYMVKVCIIDEQKPEIILTEEEILLEYKIDISQIDFKKYIKEITDNEPIIDERLEIKHDLKNEVGEYTVWYTYKDSVYTEIKKLMVHLVSYQKPKLTTNDVYCYIGETKRLEDYIMVEDPSDSNVFTTLEIYDEKVDYQKAGTYFAEIYVINSSGVSATGILRIVVEEVNESAMLNTTTSTDIELPREKKDYVQYILISIIAILVGIVCYLLVRIKKNKTI